MTWKRAFLILGAALLVWLRPWRRLQGPGSQGAPAGGSSSPYPEVLPVPSTISAAATELPQVTPEEAFGAMPDDDLGEFELADESESVAPFGADLDAALDLSDERVPSLELGPDMAGPNQDDVLMPTGATTMDVDDPDLDELEAALDEDATADDDRSRGREAVVGDAAAYAELHETLAADGGREGPVMTDSGAYEQLHRAGTEGTVRSAIDADAAERQSMMDSDAAAEEQLDAVMATGEDEGDEALAVGEPQPPPDDLLLIDGIGPRVSTIVSAAGFTSFAQLAAADVEGLRAILADAGIKTIDPSSWPEQARIADEQGADALREHQQRMREERGG